MKAHFHYFILFFLISTLGNISGQKDILVVLAHPNLEHSQVNKSLASELSTQEHITINNLYANYPDFNIDIQKEKSLLMHHDIIIFQFPIYWFSAPALLKEWQDQVITSEFSMGENNQLKGKKLLLVVSAGGTAEDYRHGGPADNTMDEILAPYESFARFTEMKYLPPFISYGVPNPVILDIPMTTLQITERQKYITKQGEELLRLIESVY